MSAPRLLTLGQAADLLGVSPRTVRRRIDTGRLPCFRDGRILRVPSSALEAYVKQRVAKALDAPTPLRKVWPSNPVVSGPSLTKRPRLWDCAASEREA